MQKNNSNKLIHEKSPYLLQHAHNPVDWVPWGEEAFEQARKLNRPIFLSIGYSTCHWCHVMEHESFEDVETAALMNDRFINIKIDREERPDVDALYMTAVQALSGSGGWPLSVWLTPDLKPFYGGTYFPPEDKYGRPGFKTVLIQLAEVWEKEQEKVVGAAQQITSLIKQASESNRKTQDRLPDPKVVFKSVFEGLQASYDSVEGGFGTAPKFPMPVYMDFLIHYHVRTGEVKALEMVSHTLKKMARGGIYDQLGGGFTRYSTDEKWVVPHFEKMLYDNAQLVSVCVSLYQLTQDAFFANLTRHTLRYILRDMAHPEGGFYSAQDADSEGKEGTFYLWTLNEIKKHLDEESASLFVDRYGVTENGNFFDPHTREVGKNILIQAFDISEVAKRFRKSIKETEQILDSATEKLFHVRSHRARPHLDDKVLTEWNGLMISALAKAGAALQDPEFMSAARKAARFIETQLYDAREKQLYRRWRDGERKILAQQTDYASLIQGLLDLFEATGEVHWLTFASQLQDLHDGLFFDREWGGYFMNVQRDDLLIRMKEDRDNVIPSGNAVAVLNGLRLARLGGARFRPKAVQTLKAFAGLLETEGMRLAKMSAALDVEAGDGFHVVLVGPLERDDTRQLLQTVFETFLPYSAVVQADPDKTQQELAKIMPFIGTMAMLQGRATAYVCVNQACQEPTADPAALKSQLMRRNEWASRT